jgi:nucleotide-binding universal stress UspA family protein
MEQASEMVMERPVAAQTAGNAIKSILFHVHDDEELDNRLQAALSLARACSAHVHLLHVVPVEAYTVTDTFGGAFVSGEIVDVLQDEADKLRARLEGQLKLEDVSWTYEDTTSPTTAELLKAAALSDLFFVGRRPPFHEFGRTGPSLVGELVCSARTPLCVPGDGATSFDPFGNALVAWNGSFEAASAVRASIGLLKMSSDVRVIRYVEDKENLFPDLRLLEYLSRHDVHAEIETHLPKRDIVTDLIAHVARIDAQYVVMGGYSHSRAGEFLFGGVTRELLKACPTTLVLAH